MTKSFRRDLPNGTFVYYKDDYRPDLHRIDGPAVVKSDGSKYWWVNGVRHRLDGPAIEHADGKRSWWVNGIFLCWVDGNGKIIDKM